MAPYWRVWVFFCFSWRTVKKKQKSKPLCLASLQGGARYPHRERQQCEVEEAQLQIGRLSLFFRWAKQKKVRRTGRNTPVLLYFPAARVHKREAQGRQVSTAPGPAVTLRSRRTSGQHSLLSSHPFSFTLGCSSSSWLSLSWWWYHAAKLIPKLVMLGIS